MQNDPEFLTDDSLLVQEHWLARYMATFRVAVLTVSLLASIAAAASEPEPVKVWVDVSGLDQSPLATLLRDELTESKYSWLALTAEDEDREAPYRLLDVKISDYEGKIQIQGKLEAPKGKTSRPTKVNCDECEVKDGKDAVERALH